MNSIFDAITDGNIELARRLLRHDVSLVTAIRNEMTPMLWACQLNQPEIVHALIEFGANPNGSMDDGETALHIAAFEGCEACVQILLDNGADTEAITDEGKTPLMNAAHGGFPRIISYLLAAGSNPKRMDNAGRTALHWAMVGDHDDVAVLRLLLSAGVDPYARNANGDTALDYARALNRISMEQALSTFPASSP